MSFFTQKFFQSLHVILTAFAPQKMFCKSIKNVLMLNGRKVIKKEQFTRHNSFQP